MGISASRETTLSRDKAIIQGIASNKELKVVFSWLLLFPAFLLVVDAALPVNRDANKIAVDLSRVLGIAAWLPRQIWQMLVLLGLAILVYGLSFYLQ